MWGLLKAAPYCCLGPCTQQASVCLRIVALVGMESQITRRSRNREVPERRLGFGCCSASGQSQGLEDALVVSLLLGFGSSPRTKWM